MNKFTKEQVHEARIVNGAVHGLFFGYCRLSDSCEDCDKLIHFGCKIKNLIANLQTKRIKKICK